MSRTPFLDGALRVIYVDGSLPTACPECGFDWTPGASTPTTSIATIATSTDEMLTLVADPDRSVDPMALPANGSWNATAYLCHLTDLARGWSERWAQLTAEPGSMLIGWDPDVLADARSYTQLPTAAATWALRSSVDIFLNASREVPHNTGFAHDDWGAGDVADALLWVAHEFHHHELDVHRRLG